MKGIHMQPSLRIGLTLILMLLTSLLAASVAVAHYQGYSAANSSGRVIYKYNATLWPKYRDYTTKSVAAWNNEKSVTGSTNWPLFVKKTTTTTATLNVGGCTEYPCDGSIWGYYQHYPGTKVDIVRYDQELLETASAGAAKQQHVPTHELGHAAGLWHNDAGCRYSVMDIGCSSLFPLSHDRQDVANSPRIWTTNNDPVVVSEPTTIDVQRDSDGEVATKTIYYPNGSYRVLEYVH
jgi:hypothetical protein